MATIDLLHTHLCEHYLDQITDIILYRDELTLVVPPAKWLSLAQRLKDDSFTAFNLLVDVCGIDYLHYGLREWQTESATLTGFGRGSAWFNDDEHHSQGDETASDDPGLMEVVQQQTNISEHFLGEGEPSKNAYACYDTLRDAALTCSSSARTAAGPTTLTHSSSARTASQTADPTTLRSAQSARLEACPETAPSSSVQPSKTRFAVVYHLLSLTHNHRVRVRVPLEDTAQPITDSVISIWPSANWYEREVFDLFGILFHGHPDLRRLLTDYGFIGHPFRKDFPLIGKVEVRYDATLKRVIYHPVSIEPRVLGPKVIRHDARYIHPTGGNTHDK